MKSLFKSFFSKKDMESNDGLNHVTDLKQGDMVEMDNDFSLPELLRGVTFQVAQKTLYEYEDDKETEWVLKSDTNQIVFLSYSQDDGEESVSFSLKLLPEDVGKIFDLEEFSAVFDDEYSARLDQVTPVEPFESWLGSQYLRTEFAEAGYYHKNGSFNGQGEAFDYFQLKSQCGKFGINIEVWDGGETDVSISINKPLSVIKNYWGKTA